MKNFSIFEQALKFSGVEEIENLGEIASLGRRDFVERESFICHTTTASVEYACLMIENAILLRTNRAGRVYAGVEKMSALQPIIDRYMRIADVSESVYLFGQDDWRPPRHPNIRLITLNEDFRLAREWFVITHSNRWIAHWWRLMKQVRRLARADQVLGIKDEQFESCWQSC